MPFVVPRLEAVQEVQYFPPSVYAQRFIEIPPA